MVHHTACEVGYNGLIEPQGCEWVSAAKPGAKVVESKEGGSTSAHLQDFSGYGTLS